ncbi:MAG: LPS export ABC transporter periplasmic protein LptC, partial [Gemmatimonadales bacterium]
VLLNMSHHLTVEGVRRAHVVSDTALFFQGTQSIELRKVHIDFFDLQGRKTSTLTSREGTYWWRTGRMQARGNVVMVRGDGGTLRTEVVNYDQNKDEVSSDLPFTFDAPDRHVQGRGFVSDPNFRDVRAKQPTARGGAFVLPNQ